MRFELIGIKSKKWAFNIIPFVEFGRFSYGRYFYVMIGWLFWEIKIDNRKVSK